MGKREELINEAARAIAVTFARLQNRATSLGEDCVDVTPVGEAALDAILAGLKTPSEEMLDAADMADELEGDYPDGRNRAIWQAMLSTLEETKP